MRPTARRARDSVLPAPAAARRRRTNRGRDGAGLDRGLHADELGPAAHDGRGVDRVAEQRLEERIAARLLDRVELALAQVADARREGVAEQVAQPEHMVGSPGGVGVVLDDTCSGAQ